MSRKLAIQTQVTGKSGNRERSPDRVKPESKNAQMIIRQINESKGKA